MVRDRERRAHGVVGYIRNLREERRETLVRFVDNSWSLVARYFPAARFESSGCSMEILILTSQHLGQLHKLFVSAAPFLGIGHESIAVADVVRAAAGEIFERGPAPLFEGDFLAFF